MSGDLLLGHVIDRCNALDALAEVIDHGGLSDPQVAEEEYHAIRDELFTLLDEHGSDPAVRSILREVIPC